MGNRINFDASLTAAQVEEVVANPEASVLQTRQPPGPATWQLINDELLSRRPDVSIRVFGDRAEVVDLDFLRHIPRVRKLSLDCLRRVESLKGLAGLPELVDLAVDIESLTDFDFLTLVPAGLRRLLLGGTKSKKPRLDHLARFSALERLYLEGPREGLAVIGQLTNLRELVLRSLRLDDLAFLRRLPQLWSLDLKLGSASDLSALEGLEELKYLELWQIKGLADTSFISTLTGLEALFLQSLRRVTQLPDFSPLERLRRIHLDNMKGITDITPVLGAPALEEFICVSIANLQPQDFAALLERGQLKSARFGFSSGKKNREVRELMAEHGVDEYVAHSFVFD